MCPQHFIIRQNIEKFHSRLLFEEDPGVRDVLLRLLIQEEDKYGIKEERVAIVEERISINLTLIDKQRKIIEKILEDGEDPTLANRMLINLIEAYDLLKSRLDSL